MQIHTTRFGVIDIQPDDILFFPQGLIGWSKRTRWVLLADETNTSVGWLQCLSDADTALAVVSPRRFVPDYKVRVSSADLAPLQLDQTHSAYVLCVVGKDDGALSLNLRAPLLVNLDRRIGVQVITRDDQPLKHLVAALPGVLRKTA